MGKFINVCFVFVDKSERYVINLMYIYEKLFKNSMLFK